MISIQILDLFTFFGQSQKIGGTNQNIIDTSSDRQSDMKISGWL